jgi:hypothetical protein
LTAANFLCDRQVLLVVGFGLRVLAERVTAQSHSQRCLARLKKLTFDV